MECNKEEAVRAKEIAEKKFESQDFAGARKLILKAQQLYPALENVPQMLAVCDVHCVAQAKLNGCDMDWYGILQVEPTADDSLIKKQYRKLALLLHPDKNKFCGAEAAFKLIGEANAVLSDQMKRTLHDIRRRATANGSTTSRSSRHQTGTVNSSNGNFGMQQANSQTQAGIHVRAQTQSRMQTQPNTDPTFWTMCPFCQIKYQYLRTVENKYLLCQNCQRPFIAKEYFSASSGSNTGYAWNASSAPWQQDFSKPGANFRGPGPIPSEGFTRDWNSNYQSFTSNMFSQGGMNGSGRTANVPEKAPEEKAKEEAAHKQQAFEKAKMAAEAETARKKIKEEEKEQKRREKEAEKKAKAEAKVREALKKIETQRKAKAEKAAPNEKTRKRLRKLKESSSSDSEDNADATLEDNLSDDQTAPGGEGALHSRRRSNRSKRNVSYRVDGSDDEDFVDFPPSKRSRDTKEGTDGSVNARTACSGDSDSDKDKVRIESDKGEKQKMAQKDKPKTKGKISDDSHDSHDLKDEKNSQKSVAKDEKNTQKSTTKDEKNTQKSTTKDEKNTQKSITKDEKNTQKSIATDEKNTQKSKAKDEKNTQKSKAKSPKEENTKKAKKEAVQSDSAKGTNHDSNGDKVVMDEEVEINSSKSPSGSPHDSSSPKAETFQVPDADFHDFDEDRTEKNISDGQIWAVYDDIDGMPRFYVCINKVVTPEPFKCRITWLESWPIYKEQVDWEEENLPVACGMFKRAKSGVIEGLNTFSHLVKWEKGRQKGAINIFPRRDDVWAIYKNWNMEWKNADDPKFEYEMVEVLADFSEEKGVEVAFLAKVDNFKVVFKRQVDQGVVRRMHIPLNELLRFSHQIPAYKMTGDEGAGVPKGCWELDPASMPPELFHTEAIKSNA